MAQVAKILRKMVITKRVSVALHYINSRPLFKREHTLLEAVCFTSSAWLSCLVEWGKNILDRSSVALIKTANTYPASTDSASKAPNVRHVRT